MILEAVVNVIFTFVRFLINLIPSNNPIGRNAVSFDLSGLVYFLNIFFVFFPQGLFSFSIFNVVFWSGGRILWAVAVWIYNKIPGIN